MPRRFVLIGALVALLGAACVPATIPGPSGPAPNLAPYVATPQEIAIRMLELAAVSANDVVYDLGSGDARIPILAARRYGARGVGVELDQALIGVSRRNAHRAGVAHLVEFRREDALAVDLAAATVVTLYLGANANRKLAPKLRSQLRPGSRIVSHTFDMGDWAPDRVERVTSQSGEPYVLYLWRIR